MSIFNKYFHTSYEKNFNDIKQLIRQETFRIMSQLSDLQATLDNAVQTATKAMTDAATALNALAAQVAALNSPDLAALEADITTQATNLSNAASALEGNIATNNPPSAQAPAPVAASQPVATKPPTS